MNKKLNGFNNGRDTTDGVGGIYPKYYFKQDKIMKKTELRIGNIVQFKKDKNTLTTITESCFEDNYIENVYESVDLTDEILEIIGFIYNGTISRWVKDGWHIFFYDCWHIFYEDEHSTVKFSDYWKVHELQNLVFSISRIELNLSKSDS